MTLERVETSAPNGLDIAYTSKQLFSDTYSSNSSIEGKGTTILTQPDVLTPVDLDGFAELDEQLHNRLDQAKPQNAQPELPARYLPIQEYFSGTQVTGISREFLKSLTADKTGTYYGAGMRYPDILADPEMKAYIDGQSQATLSRIDKAIYHQQIKNEQKASSYKLSSDWNRSAERPSNILDLSLGGSSESMNVGGQELTLTDHGASNRKLVARDTSGESKTIIAEPKDFTIEQVIHASVDGANKFAVVGCQDGASVLYVYDGNGNQEKQIALPGYGSIHDVRIGSAPTVIKFLYSTPVSSPQVVTLDLAGNNYSISEADKTAFDSDNFVTEKIPVSYFDKSGNPQKLPVFVSHRRDMKLDGKNPTLLEIYGGLNLVPQWLRYYPHAASWLEQGGVIVNPILPGDGGLGTDNYKLGLAEGIENTRLATIAAVTKLHDMRVSTPETTGIYAQSYGGMIANTVLNARPDLFGAAATDSSINSLFDNPEINVDTGRYWKHALGDASDPQQVGWMSKLDVLNNLTADKYPATLVEIDTVDGVVNVGNGIGYASVRQKMNKGETLLYARHGEGHTPLSMTLPTAFLWDRLRQAQRSHGSH